MTITREEYDLDGYIRWKKDKFSKEFYGQLLRVLMDENGMSTGELEVKMQLEESGAYNEYSRSTINRMLRGESGISENDFLTICRACNFSTSIPLTKVEKVKALNKGILDKQAIYEDPVKDLEEPKKHYRNTTANREKIYKALQEEEELAEMIMEANFEEIENLYKDMFRKNIDKLSKEDKEKLWKNIDKTVEYEWYDDGFVTIYLDMNETGRKIIREFLYKQVNDKTEEYNDNVVWACNAALEGTPEQIEEDITMDKLLKKASGKQSCLSIPYSATCIYEMDQEGWKLLKVYHQIIQVRGDEEVDDVPMKAKEVINLFLTMLAYLDSCKTGEKHIQGALEWQKYNVW